MQAPRSNHLRHLQFCSAIGVGRDHDRHCPTESCDFLRKALSFHTVSFGPDEDPIPCAAWHKSLKRFIAVRFVILWPRLLKRAAVIVVPLTPYVLQFAHLIHPETNDFSDPAGGNIFASRELTEGKEGRPSAHVATLCSPCVPLRSLGPKRNLPMPFDKYLISCPE